MEESRGVIFPGKRVLGYLHGCVIQVLLVRSSIVDELGH